MKRSLKVERLKDELSGFCLVPITRVHARTGFESAYNHDFTLTSLYVDKNLEGYIIFIVDRYVCRDSKSLQHNKLVGVLVHGALRKFSESFKFSLLF